MKQMKESLRSKKQRKFFLILPLLTLPFITLIFWALGGGKGNLSSANAAAMGGLNVKLPDPKLKDDKGLDKLSFYQQASLEAQRAMDAAKADPYWHKPGKDTFGNTNGLMLKEYSVDANKAKVYDKLDELKEALNNSRTSSRSKTTSTEPAKRISQYNHSIEADRLQEIMRQMKEDRTEDPEMVQLNEMLDKLQAIQNPDKAAYSKQADGKKLSVKTKSNKADISLLRSNNNLLLIHDTIIQRDEHNGFYGMNDVDTGKDSPYNNPIECIVPETQTIVAGSTIKLALTTEVTINNVNLPSGTFVYGTASISNERLVIDIESIRHQNTILPVALTVYDMDGQEGIFVPGSINRTVAKESANRAISGMNATMIDPSLGAQAASAGIETAKTLIGKKVKLIKVTVKSGYKVLLRNTNDK